jgi:hypothetical protein
VERWEEEVEIILLKKKKLIQDSEGNEENGYLVPDPNKTRHMTLRNPVMPIKTSSKKKS